MSAVAASGVAPTGSRLYRRLATGRLTLMTPLPHHKRSGAIRKVSTLQTFTARPTIDSIDAPHGRPCLTVILPPGRACSGQCCPCSLGVRSSWLIGNPYEICRQVAAWPEEAWCCESILGRRFGSEVAKKRLEVEPVNVGLLCKGVNKNDCRNSAVKCSLAHDRSRAVRSTMAKRSASDGHTIYHLCP